MKTSILFLSVLCCLFIFSASHVYAQAKKKSDLGPYKECGSCGVGCISCTVCDDKEMKTNCKEYICDTAGNCEELPKSNSSGKFNNYDKTKSDWMNTKYEQTTNTTTTTVNTNYVSQKQISQKAFNRGKTTANVIQKGALKEGVNIIAVNKFKTLEIVQQSGQIVSMFAVNNQNKSNDLIAEINTAKAQSIKTTGGKGLNFHCGFIICECDGEDDCIKMFDTNVCSGDAYCDSNTGKCYCINW
ncbi:MAG: hypothetical protein IPM47_21070 [Sphingobacteriales bacterium]|nr:MAG: hypothetical protein IPM47_21070 [Sphingobacteriales bacterium]